MNSKALAALLLVPALAASGAAETAAVLTSGSGAYLEAFSAFQAAYGAGVPHYDLSGGKIALPRAVTTVVTFGGKAALRPYPPGVNIVYAMAPALDLKPQGEGRVVQITLIPELPKMLARIRAIQPELTKMTLFWSAPAYAAVGERLREAGAPLGIEISPVRVESPERLPARLRGEMGKMDAFFLPPDPLLITPETLLILREFSWDNAIPFYGSTRGMTREGAAASFGISFREMGAAAARAVRGLEAGQPVPEIVFPERDELTLNSSAAKKCGLRFPRELIEVSEYLFP
ncbi:MAG: hypothetical protein FD189_1708 [Elusimicrobia bacterium]|nr:MAG: hypothetical protein FD154_1874 [Elusimicrobiota bacterium]KAF0154754.1 MAG: hypothetical protein FD189_1708 [Elusimicrobiota bacterium]